MCYILNGEPCWFRGLWVTDFRLVLGPDMRRRFGLYMGIIVKVPSILENQTPSMELEMNKNLFWYSVIIFNQPFGFCE